MGSRAVKTALVAFAALAVVATAACAPLPKPLPPLVVNTTANTFDGVCDAEDCSLLDAIHTANGRVNTNNLPNQIHLGEGTYVLDGDAPVEITRAVVINGRGKALTTIDLTSSPITAPGAVLDTSAPTVITDVRIESGAATPTHVLASCAGHAPTAVSLINVDTDNLAAVSTACDAVFVSTKVSGPASAITPNTISGTTSTLPFPDEPLVVRRFSFVGTRITGPTLEDGTTADSNLTVHPPDGININGTITASHLDRVGLSLGRPDATAESGNVFASVATSSIDLGGASPLRIVVPAGSSLNVNQSTIYGGGPDGAIHADGTVLLRGATIANAGPALVVGDSANVTARRSVLSAFSGPVCTAPINLLLRNVVVGDSCGTPSPTDVTVADHDALQLGPVGSNDSHTPTYSMAPAPTSPVVDVIPPEGPAGIDCPYDPKVGSGTSLDQRGYLRPSGAGCDAGAVEYQYPAPDVPPPPGGGDGEGDGTAG